MTPSAPEPKGPATVAAPTTAASPETIGYQSATIPVEISTRFLEHFSEFMYSSPQKAFEELISNGWDALADYVDVRIPTNLSDPGATLSVLDNGESMDEEGLRQLWHIAFSPKRATPVKAGRKIIGQFGIGKLATYVLASKLTYICKAADGKLRRVTMDYDIVDQKRAHSGAQSTRRKARYSKRNRTRRNRAALNIAGLVAVTFRAKSNECAQRPDVHLRVGQHQKRGMCEERRAA